MKTGNSIFIFILGALLTGTALQAQEHHTLPALKVSDNHRFLMQSDGQPFFWLGDTGWLLFAKLTREEAEKYLENRKQKGFTVIQVMVVHSLSLVNAYGDSALHNNNVATPDTTPGNNPADARQYDFWDHVDYIVDLAAGKGLYIAMVPIWGSNVKAGGVSRKEAGSYAAWLATRYRNRSNVIWMNGGDIKGSDSLQTWNIIGNTLNEQDPSHLITFHPFGRTTSSTWFHQAPWLDFNMFQSGHRSYAQDTSAGEHKFGPDNWKFLQIDYNLTPIKPSIDGEPSYEHIPYGLHDTTQPRWTDSDVRRYGYWSVFAGAFGYTYGHNSVMQMLKPTDKGSAYGAKYFWYDAMDHPGARQMIHLKNLMLSKPFFERVPDQSLVAGNNGERYDYIAATRGNNYAFLYTYNGRPFDVQMGNIRGKKLKASWYSPRDGSKIKIGKYKNKGVQSFDPPGEKQDGNDWVLVLEKA